MKIRVELVVDLDPELWAKYNGIEKKEVRSDVKTHILSMVQGSQLICEEAEGTITLL